MAASNEKLTVHIEFGGGTELLTAPPHKKRHTLQIPAFPSDASAETGSDSGMKPAVTSPNGVSQDVSAKGHDRRPADMAYLIGHIAKHLLVERHELFVDASGTTVRPGILVLINDADWELEGENSYVLQDGDEVSFISTLHGG